MADWKSNPSSIRAIPTRTGDRPSPSGKGILIFDQALLVARALSSTGSSHDLITGNVMLEGEGVRVAMVQRLSLLEILPARSYCISANV